MLKDRRADAKHERPSESLKFTTHLAVDTIKQLVVSANFLSHVAGHSVQFTHHCGNLCQIFFHLVFSRIISNPEIEVSCMDQCKKRHADDIGCPTKLSENQQKHDGGICLKDAHDNMYNNSPAILTEFTNHIGKTPSHAVRDE